MIDLLTLEGISALGLLLAGIVVLWRMNAAYSRRVQEEASQARKELISALTTKHEETQQLLNSQNESLSKKAEMLNDQLVDEKIRRDNEQKEYIRKMEEITSGYRAALETFNRSMDTTQKVLQEVQASMKEQTTLLREMAGIPQKVDKIAKDVDCLWTRQREQAKS